MEHHILPHDPIPSSTRVPYVCSEPLEDGTYEPYDGGLFLSYPARMGKEWLVSETYDAEGGMEVRLKQRLYFTTVAEQESFVQAWLFFGLLASFMRTVYRADDYIVCDENGTFVTTDKLLEKMYESWRVRSEHATPEERATQLGNAKSCIQMAQNILHGCFDEFDWRIRLSIFSVLEIYVYSINAVLRTGKDSEMIPSPSMVGLYPTAEAKEDMLRAGWCPSEIWSLPHRFKSIQSLVFLSRLRRMKQGMDHSACTKNTCMCYQINKSIYRTRHASDGCTCESIGVDNEVVCRILESESLPILRVTGLASGHPKVSIVPSESRPYVAISHVWADGLGNPNSNTLLTCQIKDIGSLIKDLEERICAAETTSASKQDGQLEVSGEDDAMFVWIDTICNPLAPDHAQTLSINRMYEIYSKANHVLVLDNELRSVQASEVSKAEALFRIFNSGWSQRLWTLQEAVLPKSVWVQFKDGAVDLDLLYVQFFQSFGKDLRELCIRFEVSTLYFSLRKMKHRLPNADTTLGNQLWWLDSALYNRSVSFAADEPLCLANLLELPGSIFHGVADDAEDRMKVIWQALAKRSQGLPQMMLMLNYPRLEARGYRWSPRTLLKANTPVHEDRILYWMDKSFGRLSDDGFEVSYEGIHLTLRQLQGELETHKSVMDVTLQLAIAFVAGGERYTMFANDSLTFARSAFDKFPTHSDLFGKKLAILKVFPIVKAKDRNPSVWAALLGQIDGYTGNGIPIVSILSPIRLQKSNKMWDDLFDAIHEINTRANSERKRMTPGSNLLELSADDKPLSSLQFYVGEALPSSQPRMKKVNTGRLDSIEFPPLPDVILRHARDVFQERKDLQESLPLLSFSQSPEVLVKWLSWMAWVTMRYEPKAETTEVVKVWCIS